MGGRGHDSSSFSASFGARPRKSKYARFYSRRNVLGSLGAAAYRPDVIREMGAKVNDVVRALIRKM